MDMFLWATNLRVSRQKVIRAGLERTFRNVFPKTDHWATTEENRVHPDQKDAEVRFTCSNTKTMTKCSVVT